MYVHRVIAGVGVCECLGFLLLGIGCMYVDCATTSLLLTSVTFFTSLFGYWLLGETLTASETIGAILVVMAVLIIYHDTLLKIMGFKFHHAHKEALNESEIEPLVTNG